MNYILYCCINKEILVSETIYSVMSLSTSFQFSKEIVVIITDFDESRFSILRKYENVIIEKISEHTASDWMRPYIFNVKIRAINYFFNKYRVNVIYSDSDTVHINSLENAFDRINHGEFFLHSYDRRFTRDNISLSNVAKEQYMAEECKVIGGEKLAKEIIDNGYLIDRAKYPIYSSFIKGNSGILGINYRYQYILENVYEMANEMYNYYNYINSEEFAFSYAFFQRGNVFKLDNVVMHYYNYKFIRLLLAYALDYFDGSDKNSYEYYVTTTNIGNPPKNIEQIPSYLRRLKDQNIINNGYIGFNTDLALGE